MSNIMKSFENIILRVVFCVAVHGLEGTVIEIYSRRARLIALNGGLAECRFFVFGESKFVVFKQSPHVFSVSKVNLSFMWIFVLDFDGHGPLPVSSLQFHFGSEMRTIFEHVCRTVTEEAKFSINRFIIIEYLLILHHQKRFLYQTIITLSSKNSLFFSKFKN